ncbi:plastocyanin [Rhodococcus sp. NPDC058514]|uniref:plastocyanin n=1 Tax=unclassified Rhodococcus (in: high G+C Gram-positive bacteria) TaxID=192944 RepID=UPI003669048B
MPGSTPRSTRRRSAIRCASIAAFAVTAGLAAGCSSDDGSEHHSMTMTAAPDANAPVIAIEEFTFTTPPSVRAGEQIVVKNGAGPEHSVTSDTEGLFDTHVDGGESATFTAPTTPGAYTFHCVYHPEMASILIVE